jgi:hypothetical protein
MTLSQSSGSQSIGSTEYFLASNSTTQTPQTTDLYLQVWIDLANMAAGDQYQITIYEKINAGTQRIVYQTSPAGAQSQPFEYPVGGMTLVMDGWEVGVKKLGGTDRTIAWALRKDDGAVSGTFDANVVSMASDVITAAAIATDAIGSAELAASAVSEIQSGLATAAALATVQADTDDIQTRLPAALVGGRIDASVGAMASGVLTAAAIAADAITAAKIAADVGTEIAAAVWAFTIHTGYAASRVLMIIGGVAGGLVNVAGSVRSFTKLDGSGEALHGTEDASGNRSGIVHGS